LKSFQYLALLNLHGVRTFCAAEEQTICWTTQVDGEQLQQMLQRTAKTSLADYFIKLLLVDL